MTPESLTGKNLPYVDKIDPWSSHAWIRRRLLAEPPGTRVLDIGAASGTLGRMCAGLDLVLHGIEPELEWAEVARPYYDSLLCTTLDRAPDEFLRDHQVVVLADVLEHIPDPELALRQLAGLQPVGSIFIISVPNIANLWVRLNLLFGRFDYTDRGILDRTHLRFFTRRSLVQMLRSLRLNLRKVHATPVPLNLLHPFFERTRLGRACHHALALITNLWPTLFGYQFIVEAIRGKDEEANFNGESQKNRDRTTRL
jgi:2-polyprenyl-3-methyl-5-hydroxy-6-metoxy-1,4-benzoquinol methylase